MAESTLVPASKFAKNFGEYRDVATSGKTVLVQSHSRIVGGYISKEKLDYYEELERRDRKVHVVGDLPEDIVTALEATEYGKASAYESSDLPLPPWRTDRLFLRPYEESDIETAFAVLDTEEEVWRFDPGKPPTLNDRRRNVSRFTTLRKQFGFCPCAAFLKKKDGSEGRLIGQGGLNPYIYDHRDGTRTVEFEVMYKLSPVFWGKGYATEIAKFWINFAFDYVRLPQLHVCPERANTRSLAVLERIGASFQDDWLDPDTVIATIKR